MVLKIFTEEEFSDFESEVVANLKLLNTIERSVKMQEFVGPEVSKIPYAFRGGYISRYAYILLPYVKSVSLIEFLIKLNETGRNLSL